MLKMEYSVPAEVPLEVEDESKLVTLIQTIQSDLPARLREEHVNALRLAAVIDPGLTDEVNQIIAAISEGGVVIIRLAE